MELGKKIQQVLKHYPSVLVPELGVFKQVHKSSSYDEKHGHLLPPMDYIEFDGHARQGFDLIDYVQEELAVSRTEAEEQVRKAVDLLKAKITEHGQVHIAQLGDLVRHGNSYIFKATDLHNFNFAPVQIPARTDEQSAPSSLPGYLPSDNYQTESDADLPFVHEAKDRETGAQTQKSSPEQIAVGHLHDQPLEDGSVDVDSAPASQKKEGVNVVPDQHDDRILPDENPSSTISKTIYPLPERTEFTSEPNDNNSLRKGSHHAGHSQEYPYVKPYVEESNRSTMLWYILAAVVALSVIGILWYVNRPVSLYENGTNQNAEDNEVLYPTEEPYTADNAPATDSTRESGDVVATDSSAMPRPTAGTGANQPLIPANHHWYIVIGSRLALSDAEELRDKYRQQSQNSVRILPGKSPSSLATVIWDSYVSKEQADSALRHVRSTYVPDAWHRSVKK